MQGIVVYVIINKEFKKVREYPCLGFPALESK